MALPKVDPDMIKDLMTFKNGSGLPGRQEGLQIAENRPALTMGGGTSLSAGKTQELGQGQGIG